MKKNLLFGVLSLALVMLITSITVSCKKDEDEPETPTPDPPIITGEQMPNGGLDLWTETSLGFEDPDDWNTPNFATTILQVYTTTKSTDAVEGQYSAKLETLSVGGFNTPGVLTLGEFNVDYVNNTAVLTGGIPFTSKPNVLSGSYKNFPVANDSTMVFVYFTKYNTTEAKTDTIGIGSMFSTETVNSWTSFSIPINFTSTEDPDTMNLHVVSSNMLNPQLGSLMYVDNLVFEYPDSK